MGRNPSGALHSGVTSMVVSDTTRRVYVERMLGTGPPLARALLDLTDRISEILNTRSFDHAGYPPQHLERSEEALTAWLNDVRTRRRSGESAVFRLSDGINSDNVIYYEIDSASGHAAEYVWWSLEESPGSLSKMTSLVSHAAMSFGAHRGCVEDSKLLLLYRGARSYERAVSVVPAHLQKFVPVPPSLGQNASGLEMLVPQEFDRSRVPDAVWWINFWSPQMVATVGRDLILRAPWELCREEGEALMLAVTDEPLNVSEAKHLARLSEVCSQLRLRQLQEIHRFRDAAGLPGSALGGR